MRWNVDIATLAHCSLNNLAERAEAFLLCDEESDLDLSIRDCIAEVELCLAFRQAGGHHSFHRVRQALPVWNVSTAAPIAGRTLGVQLVDPHPRRIDALAAGCKRR